jgi:hypothetical protein
MYITGVVLFFLVVVGFPIAYKLLTIPATCTDGIQNQGETAVDRGGPCPLLDERYLQPHAILWARAFRVRDGTYSAAAYVQNPNNNAGVAEARYRFSFYDAQNILVADREGTTFIMPGTITPVFGSRIDTGARIVAHTYFEFTDPLIWERADNAALAISVGNKQLSNTDTAPRITADAQNTSVTDMHAVGFTAVVFDPAGNAFAASATEVERIGAGQTANLIFSWPDPFPVRVGRIDIIPAVAPARSH